MKAFIYLLLSVSLFYVQANQVDFKVDARLPKVVPPQEHREANLNHLKAKYCNGGYTIYHFCRNVVKKVLGPVLLAPLAPVGMSLLVQKCTPYVKKYAPGLIQETNGVSVTDMMQMQMAGVSFQTTVAQVFQGLMSCSLSKSAGLYSVHQALKKESAQRMKLLPEDIQKAIKDVDEMIDMSLHGVREEMSWIPRFSHSYGVSSEKEDNGVLNLLKQRELMLMSFPTELLNISGGSKNKNPEVAAVVTERVKDLLKGVTEETRDILSTLISRIRRNSNPENKSKLPPRAMAYLYGPPGVGKTRFANNLAAALGLKLCSIDLKEKGVDQLTGSKHDAYDPESRMSLKLGEIYSCFVKTGIRNPIIFLDEAGKAFQQRFSVDFFKKMFDPTNSHLLVGGRIDLDISRVTFIAAGNDPLKDKALIERLPQITFGKLAADKKAEIARKAKESVLESFKVDYTDEDVEKIDEHLEKYMDYVIEQDLKMNPGGRVSREVIQTLATYISDKLDAGEPIKDEKVRKVVDDAFSQRAVKDEPTNQAPKKQHSRMMHAKMSFGEEYSSDKSEEGFENTDEGEAESIEDEEITSISTPSNHGPVIIKPVRNSSLKKIKYLR